MLMPVVDSFHVLIPFEIEKENDSFKPLKGEKKGKTNQWIMMGVVN